MKKSKTTNAPIPVYIDTDEAIALVLRLAGHQVVAGTIRNWIRRYPELGKKLGGRWQVNKDKLVAFAKGEWDGS